MRTRGVIAGAVTDGWEGRYHHFDSYPRGPREDAVGPLPGHFAGDVDAMLRTLVGDHPSGWANINDADFSLFPGYGLPTGSHGAPPACFCPRRSIRSTRPVHGARRMPRGDLRPGRHPMGVEQLARLPRA